MKILLSAESEVLSEYLSGVGHEVKQVFVNDNLLSVLDTSNFEVIVYDLQQAEILPHDTILRELNTRTVLVGNRDHKIIPFAAGLGIKDFIFTPCRPEDVLYRVETPTTQQEAADLLKSVPGLQPERIIEIVQIEQKTEKKDLKKAVENDVIACALEDEQEIEKEILLETHKPEIKKGFLKFRDRLTTTILILINAIRVVFSSFIILVILLGVIYCSGAIFNYFDLTNSFPGAIIGVKNWVDTTIIARW